MTFVRTLGLAAITVVALTAGGPPDRVYQGSFGDGGSSSPNVRVVDWNINKGKHLDSIVTTLRTQEPDVCLLQEVDHETKRTGGLDVTAEIAKRLGMNYVFAPAFQELGQSLGGEPALHGQSVLARAPIRDTRILHYREQTNFWEPKRFMPDWPCMQRRHGGRIALVAEIESAGKLIVVYNLHLESRGFGATRKAQLEETLKDAKRYPANTTIVIGGDINSLYGPTRARERLESEGFESCFGDRKVRTHVVWGYLDWIFIKGPSSCDSAHVIRGTKASDHDPLTARITVGAARRNPTRDGL